MKALLLKLLPMLLSLVTPDVLKKGLDSLLDFIESSVEKSDNKIDDAIVLPLCKVIRDALNIPDNDA